MVEGENDCAASSWHSNYLSQSQGRRCTGTVTRRDPHTYSSNVPHLRQENLTRAVSNTSFLNTSPAGFHSHGFRRAQMTCDDALTRSGLLAQPRTSSVYTLQRSVSSCDYRALNASDHGKMTFNSRQSGESTTDQSFGLFITTLQVEYPQNCV